MTADRPRSTAPTPRLPRLLLAAVATLVALLVCEFGLRVWQPGYALRETQYAIAPLEARAPTWVYQPGSRAVFTWDGDPLGVLPEGARAEVAINAEGLRGPLPPPGARTVVVLGDSFTFGEGVPLEETFVARLDAALDGYTFLNAGVAGHGTVEEAARLEGLLERFRPLAVVLVHVPNDAIPWDQSADRGADLLNVERTGWSRLLGLLRSRVGGEDVEEWYLSYYVDDGVHADRVAHWERARHALAWMAEACRKRGAKLGVAAFPLMHRLDDYPLTPITRAVGAACGETGTPFLDLTPAFAGRDARELWVHPADRHPNRHAHALAADALAPFVRGLLR